MKTIEEKNRMIAEFMGCDFLANSHYHIVIAGVIDSFYTPFTMKYHASWDWLMPVVKEVKLSGISSNDNGYEIIDRIDNSLMECDIDSLHSHLYDFIEWYNENK